MNNNYIIKTYKIRDTEIYTKINNNDLWISQLEMTKLFKVSKYTISRHLKIILEKTSNTNSVVAVFATTGTDNKTYNVKHYSLEIVKNIGYKINPSITNSFIEWALKAINEENTKNTLPIEVFEDGNFKLEVSISPQENTIWLSQEQTSKLYLTSKQLISFHVNNILKEGELERATVKKNLTVQIENGREVKREVLQYNLDMIISIGYRVNSKRGIIFRRWANQILKQYLTKGYALDGSRVTLYKENFIELSTAVFKLEQKTSLHDEEIEKLKGIIKEDYNKIFFKGQLYDAYAILISIIKKATKKILLIDNYIDIETLNILSNKNADVSIEIITKTNLLPKLTIDKFKKQYNNLIIKTSNVFHDRFLIIDDKHLYHIGASIKDIGKKCFAINEMSKNYIVKIKEVIQAYA